MINGLIGLAAILLIAVWILYKKMVMKNKKGPPKGQVTDKSSETSLPRGKDGTCIFTYPKQPSYDISFLICLPYIPHFAVSNDLSFEGKSNLMISIKEVYLFCYEQLPPIELHRARHSK